MTNPFPAISPLTYGILFFYGAAFLVLSFSIGMKDMKGSHLRITDFMWLLAMFGLVHGIREIVEIYPRIRREFLLSDEILYIESLSTVLMTGSYLFLLQFGLALTVENKRKRVMWTVGIYTVLCIILFFYIDLHSLTSNILTERQVKIGVRNTFGLIGGLLAAYGLTTYSHSREIKNLPHSIGRNLYYAGLVFAFYALFSTYVFSSIAYILNFPPEAFRGGSAVLITYFIMKALNIFDVEMRQKVEEQARTLMQAEKLASLGQLAAGIAHEINNPLTNVSLDIQMLRREVDDDCGKAISVHLNDMEKHLDRAGMIAQELLLFARGREGDFVSLNINEVITSALAQIKHKLEKVVIEREQAPVPDVMGDRGKLEQVFINILSNAVDAMPKGGRISISSALRDGMVAAEVRDTGTGISGESLSKVFDPFFTTKETGSGTGLGLSICYGIIKQHRGSITLDSIVGQGTTATVKIPIGD